FLVIALCLSVAPSFAVGQESTQKAILLNVGKGNLPTDTGMDDKTKPEIVDNLKELGGKALKVAFARGDSFGTTAGANKNWKRFALFRCDMVNPAANVVKLELTVVHARSTSYQTRVV